MIYSFRHRGLRRLYEDDDTSGIRADQAKRLRRLLSLPDQIQAPQEANLPGLRLHALKGDLRGSWSVTVSGNWRMIFTMDGSNVANVDLVDYH
jgi:toxin HigB-1